MSWWVTFADGSQGCIEAPVGHECEHSWDDKAKSEMLTLAAEIKGVDATKIEPLPYPAKPRLNPQKHEKFGVIPSFCFTPRECAGRGSCPKRYSCVE